MNIVVKQNKLKGVQTDNLDLILFDNITDKL
jgi:hypothetical protein